MPHWQSVPTMWNVYIRVEDADAIYAEVQDPDGHDIALGQPIA